MALRIRLQFNQGFPLGYSVEQLATGEFYDFSSSTFKSQGSVTTLVHTLSAGSGNYLGSYSDTIASTPASTWTDGDYAIYLHNTGASNLVVGLLGAQLFDGDDASFVKLCPTGLDRISVADPGRVANQTTLARMLVALWRHFFRPTGNIASSATAGTLVDYADDGETANATRAYTRDSSGNEALGPAS